MTLIRKILGVGWLSCCILMAQGVVCLAQQDPSPSTSDLEGQPNTYHYPAARWRRASAPNPQTDPDPAATPDPSVNAVVPSSNPPQPNPPKPAVAPREANPAAANPQVMPQNVSPQGQGFIGPPAPFPPTLEEMAPATPKITYQNGLLSVESINARLIDVLNGIRAKTGIQFEGIQAAPDRVAGKFGPAPANEVLTSLLQGSHFDYVIIGQPENPSLVQRVILNPNSSAPAIAGNPGAQPAQEASGDEDDSGDDSSAETPEQAQAPGETPQAQPSQRGAKPPKTAEQLLQELRQMQQRNQQNPAPVKPQ